jgi:hypothetical protein
VNILEIGVDRGGSLSMWRKYFGDGARVFGLDIDPECKKFEREGLKIFIGDQSDRKFMRELMAQLPKIDILIDDGGHTTRQQINTFLECYETLAEDGVYLCEDTHTNYWPAFINSGQTFMDFAIKHICYLNYWFMDNNVMYSQPLENVPKFTAITHGIHFYNSIVVFEKSPQSAPSTERR